MIKFKRGRTQTSFAIIAILPFNHMAVIFIDGIIRIKVPFYIT